MEELMCLSWPISCLNSSVFLWCVTRYYINVVACPFMSARLCVWDWGGDVGSTASCCHWFSLRRPGELHLKNKPDHVMFSYSPLPILLMPMWLCCSISNEHLQPLWQCSLYKVLSYLGGSLQEHGVNCSCVMCNFWKCSLGGDKIYLKIKKLTTVLAWGQSWTNTLAQLIILTWHSWMMKYHQRDGCQRCKCGLHFCWGCHLTWPLSRTSSLASRQRFLWVYDWMSALQHVFRQKLAVGDVAF